MSKTFVFDNNFVKKQYCDINNHMNIAFYLSFFSNSIFKFLDEIGVNEEYKKCEKLTAVVRSVYVLYKKELFLNDRFLIESNVIHIESDHVVLLHKIKSNGILINKCFMKVNFIDTQSRKKIDIPGEVFENFMLYYLKGVKNVLLNIEL